MPVIKPRDPASSRSSSSSALKASNTMPPPTSPSSSSSSMSFKVTSEIAAKLESAKKIPQSKSKIALQIAPMQLRLWLADQNDVACRPWYSCCLELYPRGKVTNQRVHNPASRPPTALALLNFLLNHIIDPPAGEPRIRPTHISFIDPYATAVIAPVLKPLSIVVETLTLADGLDDYVKLFSTKMIELGRGTRGDSAEHPGILEAAHVKPEMCAALFSAAVAMHTAAPWNKISHSLALETLLPRRADLPHRQRYYASVLGEDGKVFGLALMPTLDGIRSKFRRAAAARTGDDTFVDDVEESFRDATLRENAAAKGNNEGNTAAPSSFRGKGMFDKLLCAACGSRVGEEVNENGARLVARCSGCKRLFYCDEKCQKEDWRLRHRYECKKAAEDADFVFERPQWAWLKRELALLFVDPTAMPFDDLDAADVYGWEYVKNTDMPLYPFALVTSIIGGGKRIERPTAEEVVVLTQVAAAFTECVAPPPEDCTMHLANGVSVSIAEDLAKALKQPSA